MDLKHLKYAKSVGHVVPNTISQEKVSKKKETSSSSLLTHGKSLPVDYRKEEPTIMPTLVFVVSGGEKREQDYFQMLLKDEKIKRLRVAFATKSGQGLDPKQMLSKAESFLERHCFETAMDTYSVTEDDTIYLLSDTDEFGPILKALFEKPKSAQLQWIVSNPAFEIWLFYHYYDTPELLCDAATMPLAIRSQWLKSQLNNLIKGGANPVTSFKKVKTAIENSQKNYDEEEGLPKLFATQMHLLAKEIVGLLGNEFDEMLARKAERVKIFKAKNTALQVSYFNVSKKKIDEFVTELGVYADQVEIRLPKMQSKYSKTLSVVDTKAFSRTYKVEKKYFAEGSTENIEDIPEYLLSNILQNIEHYYRVLFLLHPAVISFTIDFSEIKTAFDLLGLDSRYCILSGVFLGTYDELYKGEKPFTERGNGYLYGDIPIYNFTSTERSLFIMQKEYVPRIEPKVFEGSNPDFEEVNHKHLLYSNIHKMQELPNDLGLSLMRVIRFFFPQKANFRYIKLNIVDNLKDKSELTKLNKGEMVKLQYETGDFVRMKAPHRNEYTQQSVFSDSVFEIEKINEDGTLKLRYIETAVPFLHIEPVPIDGNADSQVYYDPIVAGSIIRPGEPVPVHHTDYSYYMDAFKRNTFQNDGETLYKKVVDAKLQYVHEVQHWLRTFFGSSSLRIKHQRR